MKTFTLAVLGGLITSACWAAPSGQLNDDQLFYHRHQSATTKTRRRSFNKAT